MPCAAAALRESDAHARKLQAQLDATRTEADDLRADAAAAALRNSDTRALQAQLDAARGEADDLRADVRAVRREPPCAATPAHVPPPPRPLAQAALPAPQPFDRAPPRADHEAWMLWEGADDVDDDAPLARAIKV